MLVKNYCKSEAAVLSHEVFLTHRLYSRQNPNTSDHDRPCGNSVRGHMHQVCAIDQPAD